MNIRRQTHLTRLHHDSPIEQKQTQPKIATGLKAISKKLNFNESADTQPKLLANKKIENLSRAELIGEGLKYEGPKIHGVEPGVTAKKYWKDKDTNSLSTKNSKLRLAALHEIENCQTSENSQFKQLITDTFKELDSKASSEDILDTIISKEDASFQILTDHLQNSYPKFTKKHFIKLAYEKIIRGRLAVNVKRYRKLRWLHWLDSRFFSHFLTRGTPREKNLGAVIETLANDLYTKLGFSGQKLKLQLSEYDDKDHTPRLLLDSTEIVGFHDFTEQIAGGQLDKNRVTIHGHQYPIDEKNLAKAQVIFLLGADRDKIGSDGKNIGFTLEDSKATLQNIDPGKSLPYVQSNPRRSSLIKALLKRIDQVVHFFFKTTDLMKDESLQSDFSFQIPKKTIPDRLMRYYVNYSILQDTSLIAKVQAWREVNTNENRTAINQLFDEYGKAFDHENQPALHFKKELDELKKSFNDRFDSFAIRLSKYEHLSDDEIVAIDNLEKLTSPTLSSYKVGKNTREFVHLRVIPKTRIEWFKTENGQYQTKNLSKKNCDHVIKKLKFAGVTNASLSRQKNGKYNISVAQPLTLSEDEIRALKQQLKPN